MVQSIILTGPTAVGKSALAIEAAQTLGLEIINADSVCFYQRFNIGSAKPTLDELNLVRHHLIDVAHPNEVYHAGKFLKDIQATLQDIHARHKRALIVGGSGFYLKALRLGLWEAPATSADFRASVENRDTQALFEELSGLDPTHASKVGSEDRYRLIRALEILHISGKKPSELQASMSGEPNPAYQLWLVDREKDELALRMRTRIVAMLDAGLVNETIALREAFPNSKTLHAVGYAQVLNFLEGVSPEGRKLKAGIPGLVDEIELAHRQLAKQQRTWFKSLKPEETFTLESDRHSIFEKLVKFYG